MITLGINAACHDAQPLAALCAIAIEAADVMQAQQPAPRRAPAARVGEGVLHA